MGNWTVDDDDEDLHGHDQHGGDHRMPVPMPFLFPFFCLAIGLVFDTLFSQSMATVFLLGISFGLTSLSMLCVGEPKVDKFLDEYTWAKLDPHHMMFALLPILLFESAFSLDVHHFKRYAGQVLIFAGPAFILAFITMGSMMHLLMYVSPNVDDKHMWIFPFCLMYGAVISATDPVAVVALLKQLGVPHHLKILIEGESLFNDGAAILFVGLINEYLKSTYVEMVNLPLEIGARLLGVILSVIIGYVAARMTAQLLGNMYDSVRERAVVVIFVYACYVLAEMAKGSGVLCLVVYGISLNGRRQFMSSEAFIDNKRMWGFLAYFANCVIFIMTGLLAARDVVKSDRNHIGFGVIAYIFSILSRAASVIIFAVLFARKFGHYPAEFSAILIWGGLRGSLALLLALSAKTDPVYTALNVDNKEPLYLYSTALVFTSITVVLSNLVQGTTAGFLTQKLGLCGMSAFQLQHLKSIEKQLNDHLKLEIDKKKKEPHYAQARWEYVEKRTKLHVHMTKEEAKHEAKDEEDPEEEARECVQRCYEANLWNLWHSGVLSVDVRALQQAINEAAQTHGALNVDHLYTHLKSSRLRKWLGFFCLKWGGLFDVSKRCSWFADKPQLADGWHIVAAAIACAQGAFAIFLYVKTAQPYEKVIVFFNCLAVLFLSVEPLFRLWSDRNNIRKIFLKKCIIWPWFDLLTVAVYLSLSAVYITAFKACECNDNTDLVCLGKDHQPKWCGNLRTVILFGVISFLKFPQMIFLICRFVIHIEIAGSLQKKDEESLEGLTALIYMTSKVQERLDDGSLVTDPQLKEKLAKECRTVMADAEKKVAVVLKKDAGIPLMTTIKTRQVCREILYEAEKALKLMEEDGDVGEAELERLTKAVDVCKRCVQGLHKLTRKAFHHDDSDRSEKSFLAKSSSTTPKKGMALKKKK